MRRSIAAGLFAFLFLVACAANGGSPERSALDDVTTGLAVETTEHSANRSEPPALLFDQFDQPGLVLGKREATGQPPRAERMLIYRGDVRVEVARPEDAAREFLAKVEAWGGYLSSQKGTTLTVRVPAAKFEDAFAAVRAAGRVLAEARQANDVTEEFVDLGLRIETARKSRERLLEILQKADKVEDILKVEAEIRRLTEEIERMEGRRKLLADQVALATLQATFQAVAAPPPPPKTRHKSRFDWVNRMGAEQMMGEF